MLFAVCAFGASALATTAFAESEFLCDGVACAAGTEVPIDGRGENILLMVLGGIDVTCKKVTGTGDITGPKTDKFLTLTFEECTAFGIPCTVTADNLPWNTELLLVGATFLNDIFSSGAGTPGWNAVCAGVQTLCEAKLLETLLEDYSVDLTNIAGGTVDMQFAELEEGRCFEGATELANDGFVLGLATLECLDPTTMTKLECAVS
jgi:hypothetical protein